MEESNLLLLLTQYNQEAKTVPFLAHFSIFGGVIVENDDDDDDESESDHFQAGELLYPSGVSDISSDSETEQEPMIQDTLPGIEDISSDSSTSDSDTCDEPSVDNCPENSSSSHSLIKDPEAADQNAAGYRDRIPLNYDHRLIQFEDISQD
ncbi:hypothetical protein CEXT_729041 [Caerostris extrusa]|uniref:Uncharacterized protein n=1 Tax=Caerostris extrusa TaxID=172846 RepID=A0AAV4PLD6_CAEEX|nr:hypothetical protein CEXT_729041 [Caerostris extrusa]